ncbi:MAG: hypothetical protein CVV64_05525 [Candidatus Wallbacteria bacterium HGW-Wallbacteria-1]|jgi:hypothetical protein|uniref:DUF5667 domain-containing protein n=1 Tax=Candidatus Wallbacteria bacterium HGW-Wallbacteria-1 TaxID=2013854 RepID=A0A2N1PSC2_9BACT|nr:MAG: hypothetical protein CVV64_05525 [Candidatus Wallbacteria bacterium HGW-Wallbacteria-1]
MNRLAIPVFIVMSALFVLPGSPAFCHFCSNTDGLFPVNEIIMTSRSITETVSSSNHLAATDSGLPVNSRILHTALKRDNDKPVIRHKTVHRKSTGKSAEKRKIKTERIKSKSSETTPDTMVYRQIHRRIMELTDRIIKHNLKEENSQKTLQSMMEGIQREAAMAAAYMLASNGKTGKAAKILKKIYTPRGKHIEIAKLRRKAEDLIFEQYELMARKAALTYRIKGIRKVLQMVLKEIDSLSETDKQPRKNPQHIRPFKNRPKPPVPPARRKMRNPFPNSDEDL